MEKIPLKKIITNEKRHSVMMLFLVFFAICYLGSGAISNQFGTLLPLLEWEKTIPFSPWTIWIYMVFYPLFLLWSFYQIKDELLLNKMLYGLILITIISCLIFVLIPISYPRLYYPLNLDRNATNLLFTLVRTADTPSNCLPSLHVGLCYLFSWYLLKVKKLYFVIGFLSSSIIAYSTLTTKQHYFYDIVAGFICASLIFVVIDKVCHIKEN